MSALAGGCLCGANRFTVAAVFDSGWCHCSMCRKSTGAPALVWALADAGDVRFERRDVRAYASSAHGKRWFCPTCGAQLWFEDARQPGVMNLNAGVLDGPGAVTPRCHVWARERVAWMPDDGLPAYPDGDAPPP